MITKVTKKPTWFQLKISPYMTWAASSGYQNRAAVAREIRSIARRISPEEKFVLRLALNKHGILKPRLKFINIADVQHYHLRLKMTTTKLTLAAHEFYQDTGRNDFIMVLRDIVAQKASERVHLGAHQIDYHQRLLSVKSRVLRDLQKREADEESAESIVIDQAFDLASRLTHVNKDELIYRIRKMPDIGGDIQAIVAALFMDMPVKKINNYLRHSRSMTLQNLADSTCQIVRRYQYMRDHFDFDVTQIPKDKRYIYRKMCELIRGTRTPRVLLLYFLNKLSEARKVQHSHRILNEMRFLLAPLAERLGLVFLADDFRDQYLRLGSPRLHAFVVDKVTQRIGMNYEKAKLFLEIFTRELYRLLQEKLGPESQGISIKFRVKSPYSNWNKVDIRGKKEGYTYEDLPDILGVKIICDEALILKIYDLMKKSELYVVKGKIKEKFEVSEKDPWTGIKMTGEETNLGIPIEIQIMTREMNDENNKGLAATWHHNLQKELDDGEHKWEQIFDKREGKEAIGPNFFKNFYDIRNWWTVQAKDIS